MQFLLGLVLLVVVVAIFGPLLFAVFATAVSAIGPLVMVILGLAVLVFVPFMGYALWLAYKDRPERGDLKPELSKLKRGMTLHVQNGATHLYASSTRQPSNRLGLLKSNEPLELVEWQNDLRWFKVRRTSGAIGFGEGWVWGWHNLYPSARKLREIEASGQPTSK